MKLFISYSRDDKAWSYELWRSLRDEAYHDAWIDRRLVPASNWWGTILEHIETAECVIYIMTPRAVDSIFCRAEIDYALALGKPILPLMLKPCTVPENLSERLIQYQLINDDMSMERVLLLITMGLMQVQQDRSNGKYTPQTVERPSVPEPENKAEHIFEIFALAEEAATENNISLADDLFQKVITADPDGMGLAAQERLSEIKLERDRQVAYLNVVRLATNPATVRGAKAAWKTYLKKYGDSYDPQDMNAKLGAVKPAKKAPPQMKPPQVASKEETIGTIAAIELLLKAVKEADWLVASDWLATINARDDVPSFFSMTQYEQIVATALAAQEKEAAAKREYDVLRLIAQHDPNQLCTALEKFMAQYGNYDPDNFIKTCQEREKQATPAPQQPPKPAPVQRSASSPTTMPKVIELTAGRLYSLTLQEIGPKKINVIKAVRALTTLGLKEAKELVESAPILVFGALPQREAIFAKLEFEDAGAVVQMGLASHKITPYRFVLGELAELRYKSLDVSKISASDDPSNRHYRIILHDIGAKKIQVIKVMRGLVPTLTLTEAKNLVESAPVPIFDGLDQAQRDFVQKHLEREGTTLRIENASGRKSPYELVTRNKIPQWMLD